MDPENASEKRHYAKARKFGRMMKKGLIPDEILTVYRDASSQQKQPRLFRTELVNRLFKKTKAGEYVLCHDSPEFQSWKRSTDQAWATQKTEGVAYSIMLWNTFHGPEKGFQDAAARGDIFEQDGLWHHTKVSAGRTRTKASTDTQHLSSGSVKLDTESFAAFHQFLGSRNWAKYWQNMDLEDQKKPSLVRGKSQLCLENGFTFLPPYSSAASAAAAPSAAPSTPKAAKPPKLTCKSLEKHVLEAKGANERLQRDCSRLVAKVRGTDPLLENDVKKVMEKLQENLYVLGQCQMWTEVPDSNGNKKPAAEELFQSVASKTEQIN